MTVQLLPIVAGCGWAWMTQLEEQPLAFHAGFGRSTECVPKPFHRWLGLLNVSTLLNFVGRRIGDLVGFDQYRHIRRRGTY